MVNDTEASGSTSGVVDWLLRSRHDATLVVGQSPNARALIWSALWLPARLAPEGVPRRVLHAASAVVLAAWAVDELLRGVSRFRRLLGARTLVWLAARRLPPPARPLGG